MPWGAEGSAALGATRDAARHEGPGWLSVTLPSVGQKRCQLADLRQSAGLPTVKTGAKTMLRTSQMLFLSAKPGSGADTRI